MSNYTEGSKVNNYTLLVNKDTGVSYMYLNYYFPMSIILLACYCACSSGNNSSMIII